jgi:predicted ATPase
LDLNRSNNKLIALEIVLITIVGVVGNVIADEIPSEWKSNLWIAWLLLILGLVVQILLTIRSSSSGGNGATDDGTESGHRGRERAILSPTNNLPRQGKPFVGRAKEIDDVVTLLRRSEIALVTLTGPGGIGKTRLALQVATVMLEDFEDGVWFVELSTIFDSTLVMSAIAQTLSVKKVARQPIDETLTSNLHDKHLLLLLDSFEQVIGAADAIAQLVRDARHLKIVATSRQVLSVYGERQFPVPPLTLPSHKAILDVQSLTTNEAVKLFVDRAQEFKPGLTENDASVQLIAEICIQLEGIPLAIELAAVRIKVLTLQAISARLRSKLELLSEGPHDVESRQRTLRGTIDWSYDLLNQDEKLLFERIAVFQGGFTLGAAEVVVASRFKSNASGVGMFLPAPQPLVPIGVSALDGITSLLDKSLLRQQEGVGGDPRYSMLDALNEYALQKLNESGESEEMHRRHAHCYLTLVEQASSQLLGPKQVIWFNRLEEEQDNLRAVLGWARKRAQKVTQSKAAVELLYSQYWLNWAAEIENKLLTSGLDAQKSGVESERRQLDLYIVGLLWCFWYIRDYFSEGRERLRGTRGETTGAEVKRWLPLNRQKKLMYCDALLGAGTLAWSQGDYIEAQLFYEESLALGRELGDKRSISGPLGWLGVLAHEQGDYEQARSLHEESLVIYRELGDEAGIANRLRDLGVLAHDQGEYERSTTLLEEALTIFRKYDDKMGLGITLRNLGLLNCEKKDFQRAHRLMEESLAVAQALGARMGEGVVLRDLGILAHEEGNYKKAHALMKESLLILKDLGDNKCISGCLVGFAAIALQQGQNQEKVLGEARKGATLLGAAEALLEATNAVLNSVERKLYAWGVHTSRNLLGEADWGTARQFGRAINSQGAVEFALKEL